MAEQKHSIAGRRVVMVVFSYYPEDPRVRREAEAMIGAGLSVDVICLRKEQEPGHDTFGGVNIHRMPIVRKRGSRIRYLWEYVAFFFLAFFKVAVLHFRHRYHLVHVHNMPDVLVFTALIPKLGGARVILDLHDPMPEVFMTKYDLPAHHRVIRALHTLERWSTRFADVVLTPNKAFVRLFVQRGCPENKIVVIMNSPDPTIFSRANGQQGSPAKRKGLSLMYHGTIVERHGLGTALEALAHLREKVEAPNLHVYGDGDYVAEFLAMRKALGLERIVHYHGQVPLEQIATAIDLVDIGVIPNKRSVFTEINLPTRIFEYLSKQKQVIVPRTVGILDYFDDSSIHFFEQGNSTSLANVIVGILENREESERILRNGLRTYNEYSWNSQRQRLLSTLEGLLN